MADPRESRQSGSWVGRDLLLINAFTEDVAHNKSDVKMRCLNAASNNTVLFGIWRRNERFERFEAVQQGEVIILRLHDSQLSELGLQNQLS